jgi:uncharacterized protein (TIGR04255 family)
MEDIALESPFGNEPLAEVHLEAAPLDLVLAQIRFPRLSAWAGSDAPAREFIAAMSGDYPMSSQTNELAVTITPDAVDTAPTRERLWSIMSADERWRINFGDTFIAVITPNYTKRDDFFGRLERALSIFFQIAIPPRVDRIGVRYINRIADEQTIADLPNLVRPEILGTAALPLPEGAALGQAYCDTLYRFGDEENLQVRGGILPPGAVLDPNLTPSDRNTWTLDLDAYVEARRIVDANLVAKEARHLAERTHRFFRWAVTPEFLKRFGGS